MIPVKSSCNSLLIFLLVSSITIGKLSAQNCSVFAGNDTSFCLLPDTLQFNAQSSGPLDLCSIVEWTPSSGLSNANILNPIAIISSPIEYAVTVYIPFGPNLVVNGDFESGNSDFTNGYIYNCPFGGYLGEGECCVTTDPHNVHQGAVSCDDHTSGFGLMLVVNGATVPNSNVWEQTIAVNPNTYYMFSYWASNWSSFLIYLPTFDIDVNGVSQGQSDSINATQCLWKKNCLLWYSDAATSATFRIIDQASDYLGNDFSIDDVALREVCLASDTMAITVGGLVTQSSDTTVCEGALVLMTAASGNNYTWSPSSGLNCSTCQAVSFVADSSITYSASVTGGGCTFLDTFNIQVDSIPDLILPGDTFLCQGSFIQINVLSSSDVFWTPSLFLSCDTCLNPTATPLNTVTYIASSFNGSCNASDSITILVNQLPFISLPPDTIICFGNQLQLSVDSGDYTYLWLPGDGLTCTNCPSTVASPDSTITYAIIVTDSGCTAEDSITIFVTYNDAVNAGTDDSICSGENAQLLATGALTYLWSPSASLNDASISNPVASPDVTTEYIVQGSDECGVSFDTVVVFAFHPPLVIAAYDSILNCHSGTMISLSSDAGTTYHWITPDVPDPASPDNFINPDESTVYMIVASNEICDTTLQLAVQVTNGEVVLPTAFTPNQDGVNDYFYILPSCPISLEYFKVFNRWGQQVFETEDINGKWDGTYQKEKCGINVYVYVISATRATGENFLLMGNVTLIR